jgi:thermitase
MRVMMEHILLFLLMATMFVSSLPLSFKIKPPGTKANALGLPDSYPPGKQDSLGSEGLRNLDWNNDGYAELTVGVAAPKPQVRGLEEQFSSDGGNVTDTISIGGAVEALAVKVPTDKVLPFIRGIQANGLVRYVEADSTVKAFFTPDDPSWPEQWGPQKIQADYAWNTTVGSPDILVAIVDTGIDYTHPDLAANYVPLGYDWVDGKADPKDDFGHGTHCAGIVAAVLNNSVGIAGLAQVHIMAEKVLTSSGSGSDTSVAHGIIHAVDQGAKIISMSLGGPDDSQVLHDAVKYAYNHGVLLVAAAGNNHNDAKNYPAAYDEVMAVSATDSNDKLASFSSYGDWIDVAAPGVNIYSTMPTYHVTMNDMGYSMNYTYASGTSMACPHVTGVAALAWSVNENSSNVALREYLRRTADDLGDFGFDQYYGYGRVNARKAAIPMPEHDLSITDWRYPHRIDPGQLGMFNATVSNCGTNNETDVSVQFFVNETLVDSEIISFLGIGTSDTVSCFWSSTVIGNYNFTCYAVPVPGENMTENNFVSVYLQVRFPTTLMVPGVYPTVREAVGNASEGDTVLVSDGHYSEGQIDILENDIALVADGNAILDGQNQQYVLNIRASGIFVEGFQIQNASKYGVSMQGCGNNLTGNDIHGNTDGIRLFNSSDSVISLNNITAERDKWTLGVFRHCIILEHSSNNTVSSNNMTDGALWLHYSDSNVLDSNRVTNSDFGLTITTSPNNKLRNNIMLNNTHNFALFKREWVPPSLPKDVLLYPWQAFNDIDTSNTVDGKPIYYWINMSDEAVPSDAGCVVLVQCKNIVVRNLDVRNNLDSILSLDTNDTQITGNKVSNNTWEGYDDYSGGIAALLGSSNLTVTLNEVAACPNGIFIYNGRAPANHHICQNNLTDSDLYVESSNSMVCSNSMVSSNGNSGQMIVWGSENTIAFNNVTGDGWCGIEIGLGLNDSVVGNNVLACGWGFQTVYATNCTIVSNNVIGSAQFPVQRYFSTNSTYFHNNFINYSRIRTEDCMSYDIWDKGYPSGGNYWSDYNSTDSNGDGIGDTAYIVGEENFDHYPLMYPHLLLGDVNWNGRVDIGDIAIVCDAFGGSIGHANWNILADLNRNLRIDMGDIVIACDSFGQHYP